MKLNNIKTGLLLAGLLLLFGNVKAQDNPFKPEWFVSGGINGVTALNGSANNILGGKVAGGVRHVTAIVGNAKKSQACTAHAAQSQRKLAVRRKSSSNFGTTHNGVFPAKCLRLDFHENDLNCPPGVDGELRLVMLSAQQSAEPDDAWARKPVTFAGTLTR